MKKSILIILTLVAVFAVLPVYASYYSSGDTEFSVRAGGIFPLMYYKPGNSIVWTGTKNESGSSALGTKIGGSASIAYQGFTSSHLCLGGELGYDFFYTNGEDFASVVPLTFKASLVTMQTGKFDLNFHFNIGAAFLKYSSTRYIPAPYAKITVNPTYFFTKAWGIGLETGVCGFAELYFKTEKKDWTTIMCTCPISITAIYRH